jgi:hypothetical protein
VCAVLAAEGYHCDLGARSLVTAVNSVREGLVDAYLGVEEAIVEGGGAREPAIQGELNLRPLIYTANEM